MKTLTLLFQDGQFSSPKQPGQCFSINTFQEECHRQNLVGSREVYLQVVFHCRQFIVIPQNIDSTAIFRHHFPESAGTKAENTEEYTRTTNSTAESMPLNDGKQKIVFPAETALRESAVAMLPRHKLLPDIGLLANYCLQKSTKKELMVIHWRKSCLQILMAKNEQLVFANSFRADTEEELLYFVAGIWQEYGGCAMACLVGDSRLPALVGDFFEQTEQISIAEDIHTLLSYQNHSL